MAIQKHPKRVSEPLRPKFGVPALLGQSDRVVQAFGPERGYRLMVMAIFVWAFVALVGIAVAGRGLVHIVGKPFTQ